jgi:ribonuclease VapC
MFIDASAIVAILANEPDRNAIADRLDLAERRSSSTVALFEAVLAMARRTGSLERARLVVADFVERLEIVVEPVDYALLPDLVDAHRRYGKGSGHPARLNMGDCFSYAMAKRAGLPLIYEGDDFARTDLA